MGVWNKISEGKLPPLNEFVLARCPSKKILVAATDLLVVRLVINYPIRSGKDRFRWGADNGITAHPFDSITEWMSISEEVKEPMLYVWEPDHWNRRTVMVVAYSQQEAQELADAFVAGQSEHERALYYSHWGTDAFELEVHPMNKVVEHANN